MRPRQVVVVNTDQEPAIKEVQKELSDKRGRHGADGTVIEHSRVGDSSSNARTERAIQEVGGLVRTCRLALEKASGGQRISLHHPIVPRMASKTFR